ncbi:MAG TPA: hypothetical protein VM621_03430 [Luteibacter sp.]|uniref:hypothetical protein n=1 Tax=Luteibacter sp. TaxID=1886636 RepID=UPI002C4EF6F6|nr:hypothetical protein [Luteibacter sp.]HVI54090.1 hypothetical protein [Luteibacter sp.]
MRIALLVCMVGLSAGCTEARRITLPDGDQAFLVTCNTGSQDIGDCYNKASGLCHGPYEVIDRTEGAQVQYSAKPYTAAGGAMARRDITVQCRG